MEVRSQRFHQDEGVFYDDDSDWEIAEEISGNDNMLQQTAGISPDMNKIKKDKEVNKYELLDKRFDNK